MDHTQNVQERLEELRAALRAENISYGELAELQGLAEHIDAGDVELLEAAGVPEFPDGGSTTVVVAGLLAAIPFVYLFASLIGAASAVAS